VHELALGNAYTSGDTAAQEDLAKIAREFGALVSKGTIKTMVQEVIRLTEIPDALEAFPCVTCVEKSLHR